MFSRICFLSLTEDSLSQWELLHYVSGPEVHFRPSTNLADYQVVN